MNMHIDPSTYQDLIESLTIGSSVAEKDEFLESAKIETPVLDDLLADKVDLVLGTKGSGKTSLFRLLSDANEVLLAKGNIHIITGVEPQGDPVFNQFHKQFEKFSTLDFENFWKIYFVNLIYNEFIINPQFDAVISKCTAEVNAFILESSKLGMPQFKKKTNIKDLVFKTLDAIKPKRIKASINYDSKNPTLFGPTAEIEFKDNSANDSIESETPIYINKIGEIIDKILSKTEIKIWILLDRLDVVFEHGSELEFIGLRGLLKAYESFQVKAGKTSPSLRIKIFLRDDIFEFLTSPEEYKKISTYKGGKLPALTHITARATRTPLNWTKDQIQQLILKRIFLSPVLKAYFRVSASDLDKQSERNKIWDQVFGEKIEPGQKKPDSLSWVYVRLSDARGIVTPRSAIDFLIGVTEEQKKLFSLNKVQQNKLFDNQNAIKHGIVTASNEKYTQETKNEYPKIIPVIESLRNKPAQFTKAELTKYLGKDAPNLIPELMRIGVLSKTGNNYKVAFIFRSALKVHPQF